MTHSAHASPTDAYWKKLSWSNDPFDDQWPLEYYFYSEQATHQLILLEHLVYYSPMILCVLGDSGIGKTSFLKVLEKKILTGNAKTFYCSAKTQDSWGGWGAFFKTHFSLDALDSEREPHFSAYLEHINQHIDHPLVLILDDAEYIEIPLLQELLEAVALQEEHHVVHVILGGTPRLKKTLKHSSFSASKKELIHCCDFMPFSMQETSYYIEHRLIKSGLSYQEWITPKPLKWIFKNSEGIPIKINHAARQFFIKDQQFSTATLIWLSWRDNFLLILSGVLILLIGLLAPSLRESSPSNGAEAPHLGMSTSGLIGSSVPLSSPATSPSFEENPLSVTVAELPSVPPLLEPQLFVVTTSMDQDALIPPIDSGGTMPSAPLAPERLPAEPESIPSASSGEQTMGLSHDVQVALPALPKASPLNTRSSSQSVHHRLGKDEQALLRLPGSHYCIQVMASNHLNDLKQVMSQLDPHEHAYIYKTGRWWRLLVGEYNSLEEAESQSILIRHRLNVLPWVKRLSAVQHDLELAQSERSAYSEPMNNMDNNTMEWPQKFLDQDG